MREYRFRGKAPNFERLDAGDTILLEDLVCVRISTDETEENGAFYRQELPHPEDRIAIMMSIDWVQRFQSSGQLTIHGHETEHDRRYGVEILVCGGEDNLVKVIDQPQTTGL